MVERFNVGRGEALLLRGGKVLMGDPRDGRWAEAVAIKGGKIVKVGCAGDFNGWNRGGLREIDVGGCLVLPGLCDAHLHLELGGESLSIPDIGGKTWPEVIEVLQGCMAGESANGVVIAYNWDPTLCPLNADLLEEIVPNRPAVIHQRDLHSCCLNRTALREMGFTDTSGDPSPGWLGRDEQGKITGRLYEGAVKLVVQKYHDTSPGKRKEYIIRGMRYLNSLGVVGAGVVLSEGDDKIYRQLDEEGLLTLHIDAWWRENFWDGVMSPPYRSERLWVETMKVFLDGSFGSRTAALFEPYHDDPGNRGILYYTDEELRQLALKVVERGWRLAAHAIGDKAVDQAVRVIGNIPKLRKAPHRVEHAELLPPDRGNAMCRSGLAISVQPVHLLDDAIWLESRIGAERCQRVFLWREFIDNGSIVVAGSDWPVATPDPLVNIRTMIERPIPFPVPDDGREERLTPYQAIYTLTLGWAQVTGREGWLGTIDEGKEANITVVSGVSEDLRDWSDAYVELTIHQGKVVFSRSSVFT